MWPEAIFYLAPQDTRAFSQRSASIKTLAFPPLALISTLIYFPDSQVEAVTTAVNNPPHSSRLNYVNFDAHFYASKGEVSPPGLLKIRNSYREKSKYPDHLPTQDPTEKYGPLKFHTCQDPTSRADIDFNLFAKEIIGRTKVKKVTLKFGLEICAIQLTGLSDTTRDDIVLLVAQRKV